MASTVLKSPGLAGRHTRADRPDLLATGTAGHRRRHRGNNTVSFSQGGRLHTVPGFSALHGYDLASGVGTVNAASFVFELAALAGH